MRELIRSLVKACRKCVLIVSGDEHDDLHLQDGQAGFARRLPKGESTPTMLDPEKYPGSLLGPATLDQLPYTDTADHLEGRPAWHAALARRICQGCAVRVQCLT